MEQELNGTEGLSRRGLLSQAAGALGAISALTSAGEASAQSAPSGAVAGRIRENFDFGWRFFKGDAPGAQQPAFADASWRSLDLPHDWSIEGPFSEQERAQGNLPTGIGWYRKRFTVPETGKDKIISIEFDGVYENSEVWINGHYLGKRPYGYINFTYSLTPYLRYGAGENVIAVKVDNSKQRNSRWYSGSGIYRHVWLLATEKLHVDYLGTYITTPRVSADSAVVQIKTRVRNDGAVPAMCSLASTLRGGGRVRGNVDSAQEVGAGEVYEFVQQLVVEKPHLWSVEDPYLYAIESTVKRQDRETDTYATTIGIREIAFDPNRGFLLNGQRVKLNGVCIHHEAGSVGAAVPERIWERRFRILKQMGCNSIRTSHNPMAPEFMDLCDRMGFLVMDELFDEWKVPKGQIDGFGYSLYFDEWYERDAVNFIRRDRNRPSVVLWSAGNEVVDQADPNGAETLRRLNEVFHREDPTRLVTVGCDRIESEPAGSDRIKPEFYAEIDVAGYNYVDRWRDRRELYYSIDRLRFPNKKFIGTESSSMGGARGDYSGLLPGGGGAGRGGGFFRASGRPSIDVEQLQKFVQTYDYVAGDYMWTGIDYLGESRWPSKGAAAGVIDTCGFAKDGYFFYQSQWIKDPVLHLFPHWNWQGKEGVYLPVYCYTNCDTVELFLNGKSLGVQGYAFPRPGMQERWPVMPARAMALQTTADLHLMWTVPYEPGILKAVGVRNGQVVSTVEVATTGEPAAVELSADRAAIAADRRDVAHVTVRIVDSQGRTVPIADNEVTFEIQGEGRSIGLDNGDMRSHEDYKGKTRKAYSGLCLAIVQSTAKPGEVRVEATSPGLKPGSVTIQTAA